MSLALRLEHISHAVYGDTAASTTSALRGGTNVLARINAVLSGLDAVQKHNKPVHQFLTSWDDNIDLLHPLSGAARATPVEEWDVATKVHYLLAMYPDIVAAADDLGKIDALVNQRDVPGASNHGGNKHIQRTSSPAHRSPPRRSPFTSTAVTHPFAFDRHGHRSRSITTPIEAPTTLDGAKLPRNATQSTYIHRAVQRIRKFSRRPATWSTVSHAYPLMR